MSIKIMSQVWEHSAHKGSELLLLLAIADFADDSGVAYPSINTLARKIRMTPRTTQRILTTITKSEELKIETGKGLKTPTGYTNLYRVRGDILTPQRGDIAVTPLNGSRGDKNGSRGDIAMSPKPSFKPLIHPEKLNLLESIHEDAQDLWIRAMKDLRGTMSQAQYDYLLTGSQMKKINDCYVLQVFRPEVVEWLEARFATKIKRALHRAGEEVDTLLFETKDRPQMSDQELQTYSQQRKERIKAIVKAPI